MTDQEMSIVDREVGNDESVNPVASTHVDDEDVTQPYRSSPFTGSSTERYGVAVIGAGIVGLATALALAGQKHPPSLIVLETESTIASHQTGHNSGVIHSGLYYKPGGIKAKNCAEGRGKMYRFCQEYGINYDRCGKVVVAVNENEVARLNDLEERGHANGLTEMRRISQEELHDIEPGVAGIDALHIPETGIVDYKQVAAVYRRLIEERGGVVCTQAKVRRCQRKYQEIILNTSQGTVRADHVINCGGLQSDRVARMCGTDPKLQIVPFRGEYYELVPERCHLVNHLIYPVPDPRFPFLGVHFTRMIGGGIEAGPNAVLAFKREGYSWGDFSLKDTLQMMVYPGFAHMALKYWQTGFGEMYRSLSKSAFVKALQRLVPELREEDVKRAGSGVRAQALERDGKLVDDFRIIEDEKMVHVLNAPSPAATSSLSIGEKIAALAVRDFHLT